MHQALSENVGFVDDSEIILLTDGDLLHCLLRLNLVNKVLHLLQALLENLVKLAVAEIQRDPPVDVQVLDLVHIRHLDY